MSSFVAACPAGDVAPGTGKTVTVAGKELAVFNVDGAFHVIDNECPHRGGPLGEGELEGCLLTCPWHAWQFDLRTGESVTDDSRVTVYPCKVEGGQLLVEV
jgi:nitrite reductase/ring-hydroxylating ferredoxin subunit